MASTVDELKTLYAAEEYERCWRAAHTALISGVSETSVFLLCVKSLARLGRGDEFAKVLRESGKQSVLLTTWVLISLLREKAYELVAPLDKLFAPSEPYWLIATYFSGCALLMRGEHPAAMLRFKAFRQAWPRFSGVIDFIGDNSLNVILRQARLVAEPEEVARRMAIAIRLPALTFVGAPVEMTGRPVVFASANNHYFNTMGADFVAGMMPHLPTLPDRGSALLHLHVIDPDSESLKLIERLGASHGARVAFSLETEPLARTFTYYACSRFYVMTDLLDRYRGPILSFDIDVVPVRPIAALFECAVPYDFCCFRMDRDEPASIYQASIMHWSDNPNTRTLLNGLQHFCWDELPNPSRTSWMLDQAGLFSLLADPNSPVRFGDYSQLTGQQLSDVVRTAFGEEVKGELRGRVQAGEPTVLSMPHMPEKA